MMTDDVDQLLRQAEADLDRFISELAREGPRGPVQIYHGADAVRRPVRQSIRCHS